MSTQLLKRGTAVIWKSVAENLSGFKIEFGVVKTINADAVEIEVIEPRVDETILVTVSSQELELL